MKSYQDMLNTLEELKIIVNSYYIHNDYGELPQLSGEDILELKEKYDQVFAT